jgi:hypothetical protein
MVGLWLETGHGSASFSASFSVSVGGPVVATNAVLTSWAQTCLFRVPATADVKEILFSDLQGLKAEASPIARALNNVGRLGGLHGRWQHVFAGEVEGACGIA